MNAPINVPPAPQLDSPAPQAGTMLYRFRWLIAAFAIVGTVAGYTWAWFQPEYFAATINCVPPRVDPSSQLGGIGGITSALKDVGLTKITGKSSSSYELMALLFSRSIRDSLIDRFDLRAEYEMAASPYVDLLDEVERNIDIAVRAEGNYEITLYSRDTAKCVEMCRSFVDLANNLASRLTQREAERTTDYLERRIALLDSTMNVLSRALSTQASNTLMFAPEQQLTAIASTYAELQSDVLKQEAILGLYQQLYGESDQQTTIQRQVVAKLKAQLQDVKSKPGFFGDFALRDAAEKGIPHIRLLAEIEALGKVKAFLVPTLEQSRLDSRNATLSLMVVDEPRRPEKRIRPKRTLVALGSGVGSLVIIVASLFAFAAWSDFRRHVKGS